MLHSGNVIGEAENNRHKRDPLFGGNVTDLSDRFDTSLYLTPHSDILAHLALNHQAYAHNLLTRVGYEARLGRRSDAEEQLVRYLLFLDAAELPRTLEGTSGFADRDDRTSRLVKSAQFHALPIDVRTRIGQRMAAFRGPAEK